jgi:hypothetical protein
MSEEKKEYEYDYSTSVIYTITCKDPKIHDLYLGSTSNFYIRHRVHISNCKNPNNPCYNYKVYKFIRENGGFDNFQFNIIDEVNCNNREELLEIERKYFERLQPNLNKATPSGGFYTKDKIECICGKRLQHRRLFKHLFSKKHSKFMKVFNYEMVSSVVKN